MDLKKEFALISLSHAYAVTGNTHYLDMADNVRKTDIYFCTYCGKEHHSPNGSGSDVICCGERGHVEANLCWMDKHTPGPWRIGTPPPNGEQTIGTHDGLMVAVATFGSGTATEANARLIAAAPDLYDAAENALEALIGCCAPAGGVDDRQTILDTQQMLRAAIAKAKS